MKTKLSKKLLSALLAVMMVVTSIPMMAFSAFAADTDALESAMAAYETKMSGVTIYTNMSAAYNAYVDAQEALDAYKYGNVNVDFAAKANALTAATKAMEPWTAPVFDAKAYHYKDEAEGGYSNVVYTTGNSTTEATVLGEATDAGITAKLFVPQLIILAYDGKNEVSLPAQLETSLPGKNLVSRQSMYYAASSNDTMYFDDVWNGYMNGSGEKWKTWAKKTVDSSAVFAAKSDDSSHTQTPDKTSRFWWNKLTYHGTGNTADYFDKFSNSSLDVYCYFYNWGGKYTTLKPTASNEIYVINYKPVADAISDCSAKFTAALSSSKISDYKEGGLSSLLTEFDKATVNAVNPKTYSYAQSAADVSACANAIKSFVASYNAPSAAITDGEGYAALRKAIDDSKATFTDGSKGYTEESWAAFETAYNEAVAIFTNIQSTGYNSSTGANNAASKLNTARINLQKNFEPVETELLEIIIKNADYAIAHKNVFTADSYAAANLEALVANAKETIWANGTFDNPAAKIDKTDENTALVTQFEKTIKDAVVLLKPNNDTVVPAANNYSLNSVIEYAGTFTAADYSNYSDVTKAVAEAQKNFVGNPVAINAAEKDSVANGIALYQSNVRDIYIAIFNLRPAFSKIQNGTVASTVIGSTNGVAVESISVYLDNQITEITYFKTVKGTASFTTEYDLTVNNYWDVAGAKKGAQFHALGWGGYGKDSVTVGGNNTLSIRYKEGGTAVLNGATGAYDYHTALMKNESSYTAGQDFVDAKENSKTTILGETTLTVSGSALTKLSYTTPDIYELYYINNNRYGGQKTAVNTDVKQKINVIDVSTLFELIDKCENINPVQYTDESYNKMQDALKAAKAEMPYESMTADDILADCRTRYDNLNKAFAALELKTLVVKFNYVNKANGQPTSAEIPVKYGQSLNNYINKYNTIISAVGDYQDDLNIYTFTGWSMPIDTAAEIRTDLTYTAEYTSVPNKANWDDYNNAKAQLLGALTDKTFTTADIQAIADQTAEMAYFTYDDAAKDATLASSQSAINAETAKLIELKNGLTPSTVTADAFDAAVAELNNSVDEDQFDTSTMGTIGYDTVTVSNVKVITIPYSTQAELDNATKAILEGLNNNQKRYSIKLNGEVIPGLDAVAYGTAVIVNSDGTYELNVADTNENYDGKAVDWSYSYDAPSRGDNGFTAPKYIVTAPSFGFIVKGNTELTSAAVASETEGTYVVTVKSSTGKIIDVATTSGEYTMPDAPLYANWIFDSFSNNAAAGDKITVSANTTIIANYNPKEANKYTIDVFATQDDYYSEEPTETFADVDYNTKITPTPSSDIFCWTYAALDEDLGVYNYTILSYDVEYSFFACRSYHNETYNCEGIVGLTKEQYDNIVIAQTALDETKGIAYLNEEAGEFIYDGQNSPILCKVVGESGSYMLSEEISAAPTVAALQKVIPVYTNDNTVGEFAMIGSFILPEGYKVVEYGILFTGNSTAELSVQNTGAGSKVARYKASRYTVGNQFVINMANPGKDVDFRYRAYAIIKDADGNAVTYYSNVCSDNNYSF